MEGWYFLKWLVKYRKIFSTILFWYEYFRIKINKQWSRDRIPLYPDEVRSLLPLCRPEEDKHKFVTTLTAEDPTKPSAPDSINLATGSYPIVRQEIDWYERFKDPEDEESIHRWNWLLHIVGQKDINKGQILWAADQLNVWHHKFSNDLIRPTRKLVKLLRWESYTISERLANSCIFVWVSGLELSPALSESLIKQVLLLSKRLEYFGNQTGNHIINNARGIYLAGVLFDCLSWRSLAEVIFRRELGNLVSEGGLLREGSSHYQFLFSRWILEVLFFAKMYRDDRLCEFLAPHGQKLIQGCRYFLVSNSNTKSMTMPLLGDISPDFPPEWLIHLPWSDLVGGSNDYPGLKLPNNSWNHIWHNFGQFDNELSVGVETSVV